MKHPEASNEYERKLLANVAEYGWQSTHVGGAELAESFTYTTGLFERHGLPELLILGLSSRVAQSVLAAAAGLYDRADSIDFMRPVNGLLGDCPCFLIPIDSTIASEYLLSAYWYYIDQPFPVCQIVWPTEQGHFPWDSDAPSSFIDEQPLLRDWRPLA